MTGTVTLAVGALDADALALGALASEVLVTTGSPLAEDATAPASTCGGDGFVHASVTTTTLNLLTPLMMRLERGVRHSISLPVE